MSVDISLNSSLLIQIANFLILIVALNVVLYKPIRGILSKRKGVVDSLSEGAEDAVRKANEGELKFREDVKAARVEGARKKNELIDSAREEESAIVSALQQESLNALNEVKEKISKETEAAKASLEKDINLFASQIAEKILGRAI